jgi:hypothetical protein
MAVIRNSHARLQAVMTGRAGKLGPIESHARNVLAITRAIHKLTRRLATLRREQAAALVAWQVFVVGAARAAREAARAARRAATGQLDRRR